MFLRNLLAYVVENPSATAVAKRSEGLLWKHSYSSLVFPPNNSGAFVSQIITGVDARNGIQKDHATTKHAPII